MSKYTHIIHFDRFPARIHHICQHLNINKQDMWKMSVTLYSIFLFYYYIFFIVYKCYSIKGDCHKSLILNCCTFDLILILYSSSSTDTFI